MIGRTMAVGALGLVLSVVGVGAGQARPDQGTGHLFPPENLGLLESPDRATAPAQAPGPSAVAERTRSTKRLITDPAAWGILLRQKWGKFSRR